MKTILLFDARFRDRAPQRLRVADEIASAAVRSGVAAAADPSEHAGLVAGGALDGGDLTEVVLETGSGRLVRAVLPLSVVMIGAQAGKLASIGRAVGGNVVAPAPTPTPTPGGVPQNPSLAAATLYPFGADSGASRHRQPDTAAKGETQLLPNAISNGACRMLMWAQILEPNFRSYAYVAENLIEENSFGMNGLIFAKDNQNFRWVAGKHPKLRASRAEFVFQNCPLGYPQSGITTSDVVGVMVDQVDDNIRDGVFVILDEFVESGTSKSGALALGAPQRLAFPTYNSAVKVEMDKRGVPMIPLRNIVIDPNSPSAEPYLYAIRGTGAQSPTTAQIGDWTHYSSLTGFAAGKSIALTLRVNGLKVVQWGPVTTVGNFVTNPTVAGSEPVTGLTNVSGTIATGYVPSRIGATSNSLVTLSGVDHAPAKVANFGAASKRWIRVAFDPAAMGATDREGIRLTLPAPAGLDPAKSYLFRWKQETSEYGGWRGYSAKAGFPNLTATTRTGFNALGSINGGGGIVSPVDADALLMPTEAWQGRPFSHIFKPASAGGVIVLDIGWSKAAGTAFLDIGDFELIELKDDTAGIVNGAGAIVINDPTEMMYDPTTDAQPLTITGNLTFQLTEGTMLTSPIALSRSGRVTVATGDAAVLPVNEANALNAGPFVFKNPDHAPLYSTTASARSWNPLSAVRDSKPLSLTVLEDTATFSDNFTRADGDPGADWGTAGAGTQNVAIVSNRLTVTAGNGNPLARIPPKRGDTYQNDVLVRQRIAAVVNDYHCPIFIDENNWMGFRSSGNGAIEVAYGINNVKTIVGTVTRYENWVTGEEIQGIAGADFFEVYQKGARLDDGTLAIPAALKNMAARTAIVLRNSTSYPSFISFWKHGPAGARPTRKGIFPLVFTSTGTATISTSLSAPADLPLTKRVAGSSSNDTGLTILSATYKPAGGVAAAVDVNVLPFNAQESDRIRAPSAPGGEVGGQYKLTVAQDFPDANNSGGTTILTIDLLA